MTELEILKLKNKRTTFCKIEYMKTLILFLKLALSYVFFLPVSLNGQIKSKIITNPILKGYFADPTIVKDNGLYTIFATKDPWGGEDLAVLETKDFISFTKRTINWPNLIACKSQTSGPDKVWAPSVIKALNGKFYMYVSVGNEVWCGVSDSPSGNWKNAKADNSPLIRRDAFPGYHMIDAECFIDEDGQAYLYWGSGLNWVNGRCFVVKLEKDMITFAGQPQDITPPNYFEAPYMLKLKGIYYLMYSDGKCLNDSYKVHYSTSKSPLGPWKTGINSPILSTSADSTTYGPGHHTVFKNKNQYYILYHRISNPKNKELLRELAIDSLKFDKQGNILKVQPKGIRRFKK